MQEELQVEQEFNNEDNNQLGQTIQEDNNSLDQERKDRTEKNIRALRSAKELAEKERDTYYKRLQEIEKSQQEAKQKPKVELGDDDLAEGRHVKELKQELESYKREMHQVTIENRIKHNFPDFDSVVNNDTVAQLKTAYPELAATLSASNDLYNTAASAYTMIKKLGIYDGNDYSATRNAVMRNASKPRPVSSVAPQQGDGPLTQANAFAHGLTPELKKKLYQEMIDARRSS